MTPEEAHSILRQEAETHGGTLMTLSDEDALAVAHVVVRIRAAHERINALLVATGLEPL